MLRKDSKSSRLPLQKVVAAGVATVFVLGSAAAGADETDAKRLLKAMSDYMAAQTAFSFNYDAILEVVTPEDQVLGLASSGQVSVKRPDKLFASRAGGFADAESYFDGKTLTLFGKNMNAYTQAEIPGNINHLIDELKDTYNRPLPAADLLMTGSYDILMNGVTDIKDLGSGVIDGVECDSLAFRAEDVDWQIWIAQGSQPYPCRYVITSKLIAGNPQYSVEVRNWKAGSDVAARDFSFKNTTDATMVELDDIRGAGELPDIYNLVEGESE
jgi:hypothetical protein